MRNREPNPYWTQKRWFGGLANFIKEDVPNSFYFAQALDYRTDAMSLTLLPASLKESGSTVTNLVKWMDTTPENLDTYAYDAVGTLYKRTVGGFWSNLYQFANSHGNGLGYYYGDDYLYAACDATLGRFGPVGSASPTFSSDFLKAQGGVPTNTASVVLASASSMYADATSASSLLITGDLTLETFFKANSLPAVGSSMTLVGKWDESNNHRSYIMDLFGVSGYFGSGADGSFTISSNTVDSPIDSAATGSAGTTALSATNASFAAGQQIFIWQTQGSGAGMWERNVINGYTTGTITLQTPLKNTYTSGAQVIVMKQYSSVTVNASCIWSAKPWNGTTGGLLIFLCSGTFTNNGTVLGDALGFRQAAGPTGNNSGSQGESYLGLGGVSTAANGNSGGGGQAVSLGGSNIISAPGGAGSLGSLGGNGSNYLSAFGGQQGSLAGSTDLTTFILGGAGGRASASSQANNLTATGHGGAGLFFNAVTFVNNGLISSNGGPGANANTSNQAGSAGGSGGPILAACQTFNNSGTIEANGGVGGTPIDSNPAGPIGGQGRVSIHYLTSITDTGTITPNDVDLQDNTLVTTTTIQARLGISNDGTHFEYLTQNLTNLTTGVWNRLSISWAAASSTASFYLTGNPLGASVGTKTSINSNAAALTVGAHNTGSGIGAYFDGELNDMRVISGQQTPAQIFANCFIQLSTTYAGLEAYYTFNSVLTDVTANANALTGVNSPTFTSDVPYPAPTTRLDIDQQQTTTGSTYAVKTTISEATADKLPFTPTLDPQKSVDLDIASKGTGSLTVTVHDQQNNVVATQTIANASLPTSGFIEFIYSMPWRIVINKSYHLHVTSTVNDTTLVSSSSNNLATAVFHTYYGFLVTDTAWHPIARMLNLLVIGNERYLATWDGTNYNANFIAFPQGTHVRCFGFWREFLVIGVWNENSQGSGNIYDYPTGTIYFWDGISLTFNFLETIAEGQPNALMGIDTNLYIWAGGNGYLTMYQGGYIYASNNNPTTKVKKMPFLQRSDYMEVYPQGMAMYRSLLHIGVAANSNSTTLPKAVYSWGTLNAMYPESLSCDYPISTGNTGSSVQIGCVFAGPGNTLLVSWKDGGAYGVDQVNMDNPPVSQGFLQTLIVDNERIYHQELATKLRADHLALKTGESVRLGWQIDRSGVFASSNTTTNQQNLKSTENNIESGRGREFQFQVTLAQTNGTSPTLLGLSANTDMLATEKQF